MYIASFFPSRTTLRLIAGAAIIVIAATVNSPLGEKFAMLHANLAG